MGGGEETVIGGCCMVGLGKGLCWCCHWMLFSSQILLFLRAGGAQDESSWRAEGKENPPQPRLSSTEPHEGGLQPFLFKVGSM